MPRYTPSDPIVDTETRYCAHELAQLPFVTPKAIQLWILKRHSRGGHICVGVVTPQAIQLEVVNRRRAWYCGEASKCRSLRGGCGLKRCMDQVIK